MSAERGKVLLELAKKYGFIEDDLYTLMDGKAGYKAADGVHFNEEGKRVQAERVAGLIEAALR